MKRGELIDMKIVDKLAEGSCSIGKLTEYFQCNEPDYENDDCTLDCQLQTMQPACKKEKRKIIDDSTLNRHLQTLCQLGVIRKDEDQRTGESRYSINDEKYWVLRWEESDVTDDDLMLCFLASGTVEDYEKIRCRMNCSSIPWNPSQLMVYQDSVIECIRKMDGDLQIMTTLNRAMEEGKKVELELRSDKNEEIERMQVYPLRYVMSRDGTRAYLFYLRRKGQGARKRWRLHQKLLSQILSVTLGGSEVIAEKEQFIGEIEKAWDIDVSVSEEVKVKLTNPGNKQVKAALEHHLTEQETGIYKGTIVGINDFKAWVRRHLEDCVILEPQKLREELMESVNNKLGRYMESR